MQRWLMVVSLAVIALPLLSCAAIGASAEDDQAAKKAPAKGVDGIWQGSLDVGGGAKIRVVFHLATKNGKIGGTMDSPDQGAKGIPLSGGSHENGVLKIEVKAVNGSFEGKTGKSGEFIGTWKQGPASLPLTLKKTDKAVDAARPQEPKPPFPYAVKEVEYRNEVAKIKIAGTLTVPKGATRHPAVLMITGSGSQDRDETIFNHKPFWVIADNLSRRGIAVLRVDDRGVGGSELGPKDPTSLDFVEDVLAGVSFLKTRPEIDPKRIGLMGHSEGGLIAPLAATRSKDVAFIVLLAGPGTTGERILFRQAELIAKAAGATDDGVAANRKLQEQTFAIVRKEKSAAEAEKQLRKLYEPLLNPAPAAGGEAKPAEKNLALEGQIAMAASAWMRFFIDHDPAPVLRKVMCPVLALHGEKDLQVPATENATAIRNALAEGKNRDATVNELPGLNHLFQTATTGAPSEYGTIEETFAPSALKLINDWIVYRTLRRE